MFAHYQLSVSKGTPPPSRILREKTPAWESAYVLAKEAFDLAVEAAAEAEAGQFDSANATVETAFTKLHERFLFLFLYAFLLFILIFSLDAVPPRYRRNDWDVLSGWTEEKTVRC
jgi:hypothetical protein